MKIPQRTGLVVAYTDSVWAIRFCLSALTAIVFSFTTPVVGWSEHLEILFIGDSITLGEGDTGVPERNIPHQNRAGFVQRFADADRNAAVTVFGVEGKSSLRIIEELEAEAIRNKAFRASLTRADIVILAAGLNDYWDQVSPHHTALRLRTVLERVKKLAPKAASFAATVPLPTEMMHQRWAAELNTVLISRSLKNIPVGPRFNELPLTLRTSDGLHPNPAGYDEMKNLLLRFLCKSQDAYSRTRETLCKAWEKTN